MSIIILAKYKRKISDSLPNIPSCLRQSPENDKINNSLENKTKSNQTECKEKLAILQSFYDIYFGDNRTNIQDLEKMLDMPLSEQEKLADSVLTVSILKKNLLK